MDLADIVLALTDIGVLPVIAIAATVGLAGVLYRRFRH